MSLVEMATFWVVAPCSLVEFHRRFRDVCCLQHGGKHGAINQKITHIHTRPHENLKSNLAY
jgi:hypothetical protein